MIIRQDNFRPYELPRTRDRIAHLFSYPAQRILLPMLILSLGIGIWQWTPWIVAAIVGGVIFQYCNEYLIHRFLYHMRPPETANALFMWLYKSHFGHHDFPNNPNLWGGTSLWFTPVFALVSFLLIWGGLILAGTQAAWLYALTFVFVGSVGLYLFYEWCHVTAHAKGEKNALERYISKEHAKHHFNDFGANFHVSAGGILVDQIAQTAHNPKREDRVTHIRTLGMAPDDPRLVAAREILADEYNITAEDQRRAAL